jgi:hypothetical protein
MANTLYSREQDWETTRPGRQEAFGVEVGVGIKERGNRSMANIEAVVEVIIYW